MTNGIATMNNLRNIVTGVIGAIVALLAITLFATIGLAVVGGVAVAAVAGAIVMRFMPARPKQTVRRDRDGIIIDM
jgi:hypothetical protein